MEFRQLAQALLPGLDALPKRLVHDPQLRHVLDDPRRRIVQARDAVPCVGVLDVGKAVPDEPADVEFVVQAAGVAPPVAVDRGGSPALPGGTGDLAPVERKADRLRRPAGGVLNEDVADDECTHWTRHPSRLAREFGRKRWGDEGYAMEELVAELGAAFLSADLGLTPEPREDRAAYIGSWLRVLKNDKGAIFSAASHAQRAADFLHALQRPALAQAAE